MAPRTYYVPLDGLRGIAVLAVMLLHFTLFVPRGIGETGLWALLNAGWAGVDLFFVLSGFLITGILLDTRDDPHHFRNFYARRTLRIFPLYFAYLALLFIVLPMVSGAYAAEHATDDRRFWLWTYLGNILMARGWEVMPSHTTHLWSLAVEEQFYLVWPLLLYFVRRQWVATLCVVTFLGALATRAFLATQDAAAAAYVLTPARVDTLAAGGLVAVVLRDHGVDAVKRMVRPMLWVGGAFIALGIAWSLSHGVSQALAPLDFGTQQFGYEGLALVFAAIIAYAVTAEPHGAVPHLLSRDGLRTLGKYSYGLYLIHVPLRNIIRALVERRGGLPTFGGSQLPAQVLLTLAGVAMSFAIAYVSWHVFEKQILKLKKHFTAASHAPVSADASPSAAPAA